MNTDFFTMAGLGCIGILVAFIFIIFGYISYKNSRKSKAYLQAAQSWHSTTGTVLDSKVETYKMAKNSSTSHVPRVNYQYTVHGNSYEGKVIKAGEQFFSVQYTWGKDSVWKIVERYPVGASVTVYYNPANPAESALER